MITDIDQEFHSKLQTEQQISWLLSHIKRAIRQEYQRASACLNKATGRPDR